MKYIHELTDNEKRKLIENNNELQNMVYNDMIEHERDFLMEAKMYIEISKKSGLKRAWTTEQIKKAFNSGRGTISDFKKYMKNNKNFCIFERI